MSGLKDRAPARLGEYRGERDMDRFWTEIGPRREPTQQRWFLPAMLLILALSVPWYLPEGYVGRLIGGLPVWVWIALACSVVVASLTALAALRHWDDREPATGEEP